MSGPTVERVNEVRAALRFPGGAGVPAVRLMDLEAFCEALRGAGAVGGLTVMARQTFDGDQVGPIELSAVHKNPTRGAPLETVVER
jgi:hypothetical protein